MDDLTIASLQHGDESALESTFRSNFKSMHSYAFSFVEDNRLATEIVGDVFLSLWNGPDRLAATDPLSAWLYKAVHQASLEKLKQHGIKDTSAPGGSNIKIQLSKALKDLPEPNRTVFQLSRQANLRYDEIANQLGITTNHVESLMGKALKLLRLKLSGVITILAVLVLSCTQ